jgi:hypothetical protein
MKITINVYIRKASCYYLVINEFELQVLNGSGPLRMQLKKLDMVAVGSL